MITLPKLVKNNDKLYDPKWFKYKLGTDHVFKAQGNYWFVNEVSEAVIIPNTQYNLDFSN